MNLYEEQQPRAIVPLLFDRVQLFLLSTGLAFTFMVLMIPFLLNYLDGSFYQLLKMSRGIILWTCMFPIGYCVMLATEYTIDKANANHRFTVGLLCIGVALLSAWELAYVLNSRPLTSHVFEGQDAITLILILPFMVLFWGLSGIFKILTYSRNKKTIGALESNNKLGI